MTVRNSRLVVMAAVVAMTLSACGGKTGATTQPLDNFTAEDIYKRGEYELENGGRPKDAVHYLSLIHI